MSAIQAAIVEIDARIARLQEARAVLLDLGSEKAERRSTGDRRKPVTGTDAIILDALKEAASGVQQLAKTCKVKPGAVRDAIARLVKDRRVVVVEKSWPRQYEAI